MRRAALLIGEFDLQHADAGLSLTYLATGRLQFYRKTTEVPYSVHWCDAGKQLASRTPP